LIPIAHPPKPRQCIVEKVLREKPGTSSLTLFRQAYKDEVSGDQMHRRWLANGHVPDEVARLCERIMDTKILEMLRNG
jgi:hypothetical protein